MASAASWRRSPLTTVGATSAASPTPSRAPERSTLGVTATAPNGWVSGVEPWIGTLESSLVAQHTVHGAFHPNDAGQEFIGNRMFTDLHDLFLVDDAHAPVIELRAPFVDGGSYLAPFTPAISVRDPGRGRVHHRFGLDGAPYRYGTPITVTGEHVLRIIARDHAGNVAVREVRFRVTAEPDGRPTADPRRTGGRRGAERSRPCHGEGRHRERDGASTTVPAPPVTGERSDALALDAPYPVGVTTVTWVGRDSGGQEVRHVQRVTVLDVDAPVFAAAPVTAAATSPRERS